MHSLPSPIVSSNAACISQAGKAIPNFCSAYLLRRISRRRSGGRFSMVKSRDRGASGPLSGVTAWKCPPMIFSTGGKISFFGDSMNTPPSKVLIIDSHKPVGELIAAILRSAGLLTLTSYNITQSLAHLEAGKFDFVFADYQTHAESGEPDCVPSPGQNKGAESGGTNRDHVGQFSRWAHVRLSVLAQAIYLPGIIGQMRLAEAGGFTASDCEKRRTRALNLNPSPKTLSPRQVPAA